VFSATSLDEISNELNMTKGAFYHAIKDQDDLLKNALNNRYTSLKKHKIRLLRLTVMV
jgi:AcrR family transcriptional regulator